MANPFTSPIRWYKELHWFDQLGVIVAFIACIPFAMDLIPMPRPPPQSEHLRGRFTLRKAGQSEVKLVPQFCLSGHERGFDGILFTFGADSPIHEIRVHNARGGGNVVELRFADPNLEPVRAHSHECKWIAGHDEESEWNWDGRTVFELSGTTRFWCPTLGVHGEAHYRGCLPYRHVEEALRSLEALRSPPDAASPPKADHVQQDLEGEGVSDDR